MKTLICDCNRTMPLEPQNPQGLVATVRQALGKTPGASADGLETVHSVLCRREAQAFQRAAVQTGREGDELLVACTQEQRLFLDLNEHTEGAAPVQERPIRFVNIRETGGWSRDAAQAAPKLAALIAAAQLPAPEPVPTVTYRSAGRCLVVGPAARVQQAQALLADKLSLTLLIDSGPAPLPQARHQPVHRGQLASLQGWLGAFQARWTQDNPIDLDLCTRCNACVQSCPEGAIGLDYQVNLAACKSHRECVRVCEAAGAIDFAREPQAVEDTFDLVLDLRDTLAFTQHQPPQGYRHVPPGADLVPAALALRESEGEFEKPKFFRYQQKLCAHSRNEQIGCTACIDVCSAQAIRSDASRKGKASAGPRRRPDAEGRPVAAVVHDGGGIVVEPHLCVGCGACSTVCPSGALSFTYPGTTDQGRRLRTMLNAYAAAGGRDAALLIHSEGAGERVVNALGRAARLKPGVQPGVQPSAKPGPQSSIQGLPARVLPVPVWHTASVGLDLWLSALAFGASQVLVLLTEEEAPEYRQALQMQMAVAQALLTGLGFEGTHLRLVEAGTSGHGDTGRAGDTGGTDGRGVTGGMGGASSATPDTAALAHLDAALRCAPARTVAQPAAFAVQADKRATLELALDHLLAQAPLKASPAPGAAAAAGSSAAAASAKPIGAAVAASAAAIATPTALPEAIALPATGSPFGSLVVDPAKCTLCLSCVGACPESALADNPQQPQLRFTEKNCVQCGLCATTCPEQAITLQPRLWLAEGGKARKATRVLHEAAPFNCVRCAKPFGTLRAIENMIEKLSSHAAFQGAGAQRLKMCSDCRVVDMFSNPNEVRITDL